MTKQEEFDELWAHYAEYSENPAYDKALASLFWQAAMRSQEWRPITELENQSGLSVMSCRDGTFITLLDLGDFSKPEGVTSKVRWFKMIDQPPQPPQETK